MSDPESAREARRWLRYAVEDLESARRMLADPADPPRIACHLAQQAAEKALKGALAYTVTDFPYVHDLGQLAVRLPAGWRAGAALQELDALSVWAVRGRYPGDLPDASHGDAVAAVQTATAVVDAVLADMKARGVEPEAAG